MFLTTPFLLPVFFSRESLRNLMIVVRPPYWDLPLFPDAICRKYDEAVSNTMHMLEHLLQVKHQSGFHLRIIVIVRRMFDQGFSIPFRPNANFCR
jgi:hypothetical protein